MIPTVESAGWSQASIPFSTFIAFELRNRQDIHVTLEEEKKNRDSNCINCRPAVISKQVGMGGSVRLSKVQSHSISTSATYRLQLSSPISTLPVPLATKPDPTA